ncbi:hypothetical protein niasHS_009242 [Heterodera schachtii]|uniref:RING-type domain-containing protein n=1 Tax=Heterodera schachtii TaxID=97005 RepID=A0ABD2IYR0_HETSC
MRQHLSFVLVFLAKRHRIRLSDSKERIILTEQSLNDFLEESYQLMSQAKNCANYRTKRGGKNYSRRKRLLQFISKAIQIDWDGIGLLNRSKNTKNRRRKRKRLMNILEPITLAVFLLFLVIFIVILFILCNDMIISFRNGTAFGSGTNAAITEQLEQRDSQCLNAFKEIPPVVVDRQNGGERDGEEDEQLDCAICLGPIDYGTEVRPLPVCKHKFHDECIELWIQGGHNACPFCRQEIFNLQLTSPTQFAQHRQTNGTMPNEATVIEIANGRTEIEGGRGEEEEEGRTTAESDQV